MFFQADPFPLKKSTLSKAIFSLLKILPSFLWLYYKKLYSVPVFLQLGHDILRLVFQHSVDNAD